MAQEMTIEGLTFYVNGGRAYLTPQSYQKTNRNMWRSGTAMASMASEYKSRADRILAGLNSGGYTSERGMRYTVEKPGYIRDEAVSGEALATHQRVQSMGGFGETDGASLEDEDFEDPMEEIKKEAEESLAEISEIYTGIQQQSIEYQEMAIEVRSGIAYSPGEVFVG